jgi:hypothetical protein
MLLYLATGAKFMLIIRALAALCLPGCANAASVAFPTPPQRIVSDGTFQVFFKTTTLRMHRAASDNTMLDYGQVAIGATRGRLRVRLTEYYSSPQLMWDDFYYGLSCEPPLTGPMACS